MNDDLGRGMLGWQQDRWTQLDSAAANAVAAHVIMRNLVDRQDNAGAHNVRIAGNDVGVKTLVAGFSIDMKKDEDEDVDRKVANCAAELARLEDKEILDRIVTKHVSDYTGKYDPFVKAKNELNASSIGVVVTSEILTELETTSVAGGARTALDAVQNILGTTFLQSSAFERGLGKVEAIVLKVTPPSARIVTASGPRIRVLKVDSGKVELQIEEEIAVGTLDPDMCVRLIRK